MASRIVFDALLAGMLVLLVPIGFWRGGGREAIVGGSLLAGASLGNAFAVRWGSGIADLLGSRDSVGETVLAEAMLWGSVIVLGYLGGATISHGRQSLAGRLAGSIIALFNGLLLLGFSLRFLTVLLLGEDPDRWTEGGFIAGVLSRGTEELLLLAVVVISVGVISGLIARLFGAWDTENDLLETEQQYGQRSHAWPATPPAPRPLKSSHRPEDQKIEPDIPSRGVLSDLHSSASWMRHEPTQPRFQGDRAVDGSELGSRNPHPPSVVDAPDGASVVSDWLRKGSARHRVEQHRGPDVEE